MLFYFFYVWICLLFFLNILLISQIMWSFGLLQRIVEEIMREREEEVRNINRGMHQVNEIYKVS